MHVKLSRLIKLIFNLSDVIQMSSLLGHQDDKQCNFKVLLADLRLFQSRWLGIENHLHCSC